MRKSIMKLPWKIQRPYKTHKCTIGFAENVELMWSWVMEGKEVDTEENQVEYFNYCPECGRKLK